MINSTYTGISQKLEQLYDDPTVYFDKLPQNFSAPCFFVKLINSTRKPCLWKRSELKLDFDIMYYPAGEPEDVVSELNDVGYKLLWGLEFIPINESILRGTDLNYKIEDSVLHFFATYRMMIVEVEDAVPKMESLAQQYRIKS